LKRGQLYVDDKSDTILLPISAEQFVPFHVGTVNTVSKSDQGQWTYLRINFHTPSAGKPGALQFPDLTDPNAVFLKEVTFKNQDRKGENNHLKVCEK
jgi:nucleosome binding factor SPN SPT16 subunit